MNNRPLELHVWGPAFGLPSIDPESAAAIAYLKQSLRPEHYRLLQNSPSGVPTHSLPALYNPATDTWTSGFYSITTHLRRDPPPSYQDPDAGLSETQRADAAAYSTYLALHAGPLVALSLYVSSANWAETTRPAYSQILSFPLTWAEPLAVRTAMAQRAAHLNMSSLDTDAEAERETDAEKAAAAAGWVTVPKSLRAAKRSITDAMAPEQKARIRLDALAVDALDVLQDWDVLRDVPHDSDPDDAPHSAVACLAFAYLALMLVPEVPRPWLRDTLRARYPSLCAFVERFRAAHFAASPWDQAGASRAPASALRATARFATAAVHGIPGVGEELRRWWAQGPRRAGQPRRRWDVVLGAAGTGLLVLAVSAGAWFWYRVPRYGLPLYRYERARTGLRGLGAAGAMFMMPSAQGDGGLDNVEG